MVSAQQMAAESASPHPLQLAVHPRDPHHMLVRAINIIDSSLRSARPYKCGKVRSKLEINSRFRRRGQQGKQGRFPQNNAIHSKIGVGLRPSPLSATKGSMAFCSAADKRHATRRDWDQGQPPVFSSLSASSFLNTPYLGQKNTS